MGLSIEGYGFQKGVELLRLPRSHGKAVGIEKWSSKWNCGVVAWSIRQWFLTIANKVDLILSTKDSCHLN